MGSGGTEAGTRGVKIPHHQVPTGKNECGRSYSRIDREEILGLFLHAPTAMIGGVLVGFVSLRLLTPSPLPNIGFYNPLFWGRRALLRLPINYRSAYWVGAIGVLYLVSVIFSNLSGFRQSPISEIQQADT